MKEKVEKLEEELGENDKAEEHFNKTFDMYANNIILNFLNNIDQAVAACDKSLIDYYVSRYKIFVSERNEVLPDSEEEYEEFYGI